ncbi:hypothetical protein HII31_03740 [Pseudocercospora fuligena]|uniref:Uncharacterized protein n=1 Tax=Pseudocercospora fuligena TaxID=685502 RepID=A0A8H6RQ73_9PEZI|nr:hypothetical protein HII31_03740 [Pseudocercospora fuligena]
MRMSCEDSILHVITKTFLHSSRACFPAESHFRSKFYDVISSKQNKEMANTAAAVTSTSSAAARVFAIPELLENIILEVMHNPEYPQPCCANAWLERFRETYVTDSFAGKRVSRGFNQVIIGSSKIQDAILAPRISERVQGMAPSLYRTWWLGNVSWLVSEMDVRRNTVYIRGPHHEFNRSETISTEMEASWRQVKCLPNGGNPIQIELVETKGGTLVPDARSKSLQIDENYTLGELYEEMAAMCEGSRYRF